MEEPPPNQPRDSSAADRNRPGPLWEPPSGPPRPPLEGSAESEFTVVGGGIAGVATALLLAEAGRSVTLLEARRIGDGTTGRSTAKVSLLQGARHRLVARRHGRAAARDLAAVQRTGFERIASWVEAFGIDCDWQRRPAVTYATTREGAALVADEATAAADAGVDVQPGGADGLPFPVTAAISLADQAQFSPRRFLEGLVRRLDASPNASVHEHSRVEAVEGRGPHRVVTADGEVRSDAVVIATLLPILDRGLFFARAQPTMSYAIALETDGPAPPGMYLSVDEPTRSLRTAPHRGGEVLIVGGEGTPIGDGPPPSVAVAELERWARLHFPVGELVAAWSAHDQTPADHLPYVGPMTPRSSRVLVATGFEKWGITMGVAAAAMLTSRLIGDGDPDVADRIRRFDPARLDIGSLPEAARINLRVAARLVGGWLHPDEPEKPAGGGRRVRAGLAPVGLSEEGDAPTSLRVVCTHLGGICRWNDLDRTWDCPLHGSRFAADGTVIAGPAIRPLGPSDRDGGDAGSPMRREDRPYPPPGPDRR